MRKIFAVALSLLLALTMLAGCTQSFDPEKAITVIDREPGSGTRDAFLSLFSIAVADVYKEAATADKTSLVLGQVKSNPQAIGYISLGSLNDTVKALKVDGADPTAANVKNGTYAIQRPFYVAYKDTLSAPAQDFLNFILSKDGQKVIGDFGCIAINDNAPAFSSSNASGTIKVGGSSSVTPVMEKLKEAYEKINKNAKIELFETDSGEGMTGTSNGNYDIGMASRALKDAEKETLADRQIAIDGIAIIVNKNNPLDNVTKEQVKKIYTGEYKKWGAF
ncbi:MAG: substrate-binding domain-containing protein [Clostridiales bacterium]|nr:substrate-binding domain-containing protein [Clostridiales bacterium]